MGLGHFGGGVGVSRFLAEHGAKVTITDTSDSQTLTSSIKHLEDLEIEYHLGEHTKEDFIHSDLIVVNPAVPKHSPWLKLAEKNHIPQTTEMNLFFDYCPAPIIGVTGSNGKSTTTAMISEILRATTDKTIWTGGNIGQTNLLQQIDKISEKDWAVLELSSFQLYDLGLSQHSPQIAILTNITENHIDWHGDMDAYVDAKKNILRYQHVNDHAIFNHDDPEFNDWPILTNAQTHWYSIKDTKDIQLAIPGNHNKSNAAAALQVANILKLSRSKSIKALENFHGLPHRLELIRHLDGVTYYNDSISTTPQSTIAAIESFDKKKVLILGGYDKQIDFSPLIESIAQPKNQVETVILIGQVKESLLKQLQASMITSSVAIQTSDTLEQAIELAQQHATDNSVVLLSPACASYDMFKNFQDRGDQFRHFVNLLT